MGTVAVIRRGVLSAQATLDACRHGGVTGLGDAERADQAVIALSGHKSPEAARLYVKGLQCRD